MSLFSRRTLITIFALGAVTFLIGLLVTAFGGTIFGEFSAHNDTYSRSLVGHHAFTAFLKQSGISVVVSRNTALYEQNTAFPLLLIEPVRTEDWPCSLHGASGSDRSGEEQELDDGRSVSATPEEETGEEAGVEKPTRTAEKLIAIIDAASRVGRPVVLVLPKWAAMGSTSRPGWIEAEWLLPVDFVAQTMIFAEGPRSDETDRADDPPVLHCAGLSSLRAEPLGRAAPCVDLGKTAQVLSAALPCEPLLWSDEGVLIGRYEFEDRNIPIVVVSDPDLLNNRGLGRGDHASLLHSLISGHLNAEGVIIDETLHGYKSDDTILKRAFSFPLVLLVIHAALLLALTLWAIVPRFGKELPPPSEVAPGKDLLIDNTAKLLLTAGNHTFALHRYLESTLAVLKRRFYLPQGTSLEAVILHLQGITDMRGISLDVAKLIKAARSPSLTHLHALRLGCKIHAWRERLLDKNKEN